METPQTDSGRTVNIAQAVALLGRTRRTVYYWIKAGYLHRVETAAGPRVTWESVVTCKQVRCGR